MISPSELDDLYFEVEKLVGREVEVSKLKDGKHIVLYMNMSYPPPPTGATEEEALRHFIEWFTKMGITEPPEPEPDLLEGL